MRFETLRLKYHLLPHATYGHSAAISSLPRRDYAYLLLLKPRAMAPGDLLEDTASLEGTLATRLGRPVQILLDNEAGSLFHLGDQGDRHARLPE